MKKIIVLFISFACFFSCSIDDEDNLNYKLEFVGIETVDIPEEFVLGEVHEISMTYFRPSSCHVFYDFFYEIDGNERTVAVVNIVPEGESCAIESEDEQEVALNFQVNSAEPYIFRFYQGEDEDGEDVYQIVEVPVSTD